MKFFSSQPRIAPRYPSRRAGSCFASLFRNCPGFKGWTFQRRLVTLAVMERVVAKHPLGETPPPEPVLDPVEAMTRFEQLLKRGWEFYPPHDPAKGYPRVYRIIPLAES